ncbi:class I SAM-dependent methyltransferase [Candidatus Uhrbacteria bacterium CG_4_10_14_0_2_um_filter_41_7]|uniref:Class I SAM-dependent methyltransferase n=1 Tax=Candidatus Uhrbacteria bacterium CG_4_9_14_3_um_filter_41_35 TaxID=1975034 RepID=A0A2M7XGD5_9BACT|nr:MAG: hypothetical protein COV92_03760 [Candidatus Uhrbacteria bacterium CG11_big_fil_rev_8_21_14_0_20_41_9]PIZ54126.1 MAG: class I SAM-dependent methyltransferase [Candidatus Uhrbacteria bacterium CG_4_10_14_0_2_um_filter_41_7]PJA46934.1 MAG: class I SAM-dependent methyltransferase [Candidatus Uhrbacteria bacterium CG_4_9_14_3_um_filter_41_35]
MKKPETYYINARIEMLQFVPRTAKKILDIGCGEGVFGSILKNELQAEVWGIEMDVVSGTKAGQVLDKVIISDVFSALPKITGETFDAIILNDVLEHIVQNEVLLTELKKYLNEDAVIVASIPNVRFLNNLINLIFRKTWDYEDSGILDRTHVRFFTKKSIIKMFERLGFNLDRIQGLNGYVDSSKFSLINILTLGLFADTRYLQFGIVVKTKK